MVKKELFGWFESKTTFTKEDVMELLERVKKFNAGAIDQYLTNHVDQAFNEWLTDLKAND